MIFFKFEGFVPKEEFDSKRGAHSTCSDNLGLFICLSFGFKWWSSLLIDDFSESYMLDVFLNPSSSILSKGLYV